MTQTYDAIVIGARCAGAPTAMLLARMGYRILMVDRSTFPSDTVSTHFVHAPGVAALERWGLRDKLAASGCPPVRTYTFDFGPFTIQGSPERGRCRRGLLPRRPVLDTMLVHAAANAGVEVREAFSVGEILVEDGAVIGIRSDRASGSVTEHANVVVGADGRNSLVAKAVQPEQYNERPAVSPAFLVFGVTSEARASRPISENVAAWLHSRPMTISRWSSSVSQKTTSTSPATMSKARSCERSSRHRCSRTGCGQASVRNGSTPPPTLRVISASLTGGLGARGRLGLPPPSHHRAGHHRCLSRRRASCQGARRSLPDAQPTTTR